VRTPFADRSIRRVFSRIVANLPLINSITGPPVNLAITPDQHLALVANSLDWVKDGEDWKGIPDNKIFVIDLTASPPVQIATVEAGKQPSGMAINKAGTLALVANRADDSVRLNPGVRFMGYYRDRMSRC
jgi:DNA-binding beta-propeller fold protein YncE